MNRRERRKRGARKPDVQFLITGEPIAETASGLVMRLGAGGEHQAGHDVTVMLRAGISQAAAGAELRRLAVELEEQGLGLRRTG